MTHITKGANTPVPAGLLRVAVCRQNISGAPVVDASALLLDAHGKVRGDADLVFYNQPTHPSGAVRHTGTADGGAQLAEWLELDLPRVEPDIQRVLITGSCDGGVFGAVPGLYVQALTAEGTVVAHYAVTDASSETAFVLGEFYRRGGEWKFRAVGQGYASGLAGLATDFGIAVEEPAPAPAAAAVTTPAAAPFTAPPPPLAPPAPVAPAAPMGAVPPLKVAGPPPQTAPPQHTPAPQGPQDAVPYSFGPDFQPYVQRGRGNGVVSVDVPIPPGPVIVEAWHEGEGYFGMHTLSRRNKDDDLVFNNTDPDFRGRALVQTPDSRPLRLRVEADNNWTVLIQPLSVARAVGTTTLQGYGPEVLVHTGPAADLDLDYLGDEEGEGYIGLKTVEPKHLRSWPEDYGDLLVNDTDRQRHTVPIPEGPLVLALEAEGHWTLTARPIPGADRRGPWPFGRSAPAAAPAFDQAAAQASGTYEGHGGTTITLVNPTPGRPAILEYALTDENEFSGYDIKRLDEYDDEDDFLTSRQHGQRGRTLLFGSGQSDVRLKVEGAADWSLRLLPVEQAPALTGPAEGTGSAVFRYDGPPALLGLARTGSDDASLTARTVQATGKTAISADTAGRRRPVTGPLWVTEAGHCYVLVHTGEHTSWRIEPTPLAAAPVLDGLLEGQGYGVVRHTGPETEMMLTHESRGMLDLLVLWELDERLQPVRRISTASGLQRLPSGFLQIRTSGRWTIENRG